MHKSCDSHVTCMSHYTYRIQCMLGNLQVRAQGIGDFAAQSEKVTKKRQRNVPLILPCFQAFPKLDGWKAWEWGDCEGWQLPDGHSWVVRALATQVRSSGFNFWRLPPFHFCLWLQFALEHQIYSCSSFVPRLTHLPDNKANEPHYRKVSGDVRHRLT